MCLTFEVFLFCVAGQIDISKQGGFHGGGTELFMHTLLSGYIVGIEMVLREVQESSIV